MKTYHMLKSQGRRGGGAAGAGTEQPGAERMPVEELARRTGTTVSNLRALQARGLLAPPQLVGRKGYYTERHQARVALLRRLQDRGYSLSAIDELLRGWERGAGLPELLGLEDAMNTPLSPAGEDPGSADDVARLLPELLADDELLARALELEVVARREGRVVAPSVELLEIARAHLRAGIPLGALLEEMARLRDDGERIAQRFRALFHEHVFAPFMTAGAPAVRLPLFTETVARLRPASARAAAIALARAIERGGTVPRTAEPARDVELEKPARARRAPRRREKR